MREQQGTDRGEANAALEQRPRLVQRVCLREQFQQWRGHHFTAERHAPAEHVAQRARLLAAREHAPVRGRRRGDESVAGLAQRTPQLRQRVGGHVYWESSMRDGWNRFGFLLPARKTSAWAYSHAPGMSDPSASDDVSGATAARCPAAAGPRRTRITSCFDYRAERTRCRT